MSNLFINTSEWPFYIPIALSIFAVLMFALSKAWPRAWSILFGSTLLAVLAGTMVAAWAGLWLPANGASFGGEVDLLFNLILVLTTFFFILTEAILVWSLWNHKPPEGKSPSAIHGNHRLELAWTIVPALLLAGIAVVQMPTWARMKGAGNESWLSTRYEVGSDKADLLVCVHGRQWEWRVRYHDPALPMPTRPLDWAAKAEPTDLHAVNEIHAYPGAKVRLLLRTHDVIHSFFVPQLRIKQDMLPGRTTPAWFIPTPADSSRENRWEIACAELCGGNHYRMRGQVVIHPDKAAFDAWYASSAGEQSRRKRSEKAVASAPKAS
ncbi:MAG: cytochrome c oxidase subunit II [Planctomycetota bacterium]